ncbi:hypothetical protein RND81_04G137500 [Saponaria officinalis]|uniref:Secreted protein n=1 Tax=Saponaria officinalis TaxID=3572 RepID=A0AAW1LP35_SAPOF
MTPHLKFAHLLTCIFGGIQTVATACMFLAGKVEETPRPLRDVILVCNLQKHGNFFLQIALHKILRQNKILSLILFQFALRNFLHFPTISFDNLLKNHN